MTDENPAGIAHPSAEGVTAVDLGEHGTIHVPDDNIDPKVRYELPNSDVKHEWVNPNAPAQPITNPGPDDDVIWDAALQAYIPRVRKDVSETLGSAEAQTAR